MSIYEILGIVMSVEIYTAIIITGDIIITPLPIGITRTDVAMPKCA